MRMPLSGPQTLGQSRISGSVGTELLGGGALLRQASNLERRIQHLRGERLAGAAAGSHSKLEAELG